ncbi:hypothetical protein O9992_06050 [Vibrio lentus]|nr:hypothetical protein [Vibrio lentus]
MGGASDMNKLGTIALTAASGSTSSQAEFTFGANGTLASTETIILEKMEHQDSGLVPKQPKISQSKTVHNAHQSPNDSPSG